MQQQIKQESRSETHTSSSSFIPCPNLACKRETHPLIFGVHHRSMRIRKRSGPLGFSSISTTIALSQYSSDPSLTSTTRKHEEEEEEEKKRLHPSFGDENQPSDQVYQTSKTSSNLELTFIRGNNSWICCSDDGADNKGGLVEEEEKDDDQCMMNTNPTHKMEEMNKELKGLKEEDEKMMIRSTSTTATKNRRSNSLGGEEEVTNFGSGVPTFSSNISSSHDDLHQVLLHEMWCEGVVLKGFPMKKRRGSNCERKVVLGDDQEITRTTKTKTTEMIKQKKIMKTTNPNNKKWVLHEKDSQEITDSTSSPKKNEEGSRCSRINGRGWRCCQQALVGYSLCEHHSGKGRLFRSMNSARNRSSTAATITGDVAAKPMKNLETRVSLMEENCHEEDDDDEKTSTTMMRIENKKRKKTGMVKARSISSLLGQTQVHA